MATTNTTVMTTTTVPTATVDEATLPVSVDCVGLGDAPTAGQLTFVAMERLWQIEPDGSIACLAEVPDSTEMVAWSPRGERVVFSDGRVLDADGESRAPGGISGNVAGWTWPTGLRFLETDGPALRKHEADGSAAIDISVVDHHEVVTYHPDGIHVAVFGNAPITLTALDEDGNMTPSVFDQLSLFIVRNGDAEPHQLVTPVDATITDAAFSSDGTRISFVAVHEGSDHHVHSFDLSAMIFDDGEQKFLTQLREEQELTAIYVESAEELHHLTIDPANPDRLLYADGTCGAGSSVHLVNFVDEATEPISIADGLAAIPIGFLSGNRAAVLEVADDCQPTGALWVIDLADGARTKVAEDVASAAVRAPAPDLNLSLQGVTITGFA
jgi:dipeptidyl aminopeptidase/acylaminoacyl peptidase